MTTTSRIAPRLQTARLIAASMILGVTVFAVVAWWTIRESGAAPDNDAAAPFLYVWIGVTFASLAAALILWRLRVAPTLERPASGGRDETLLSNLIVTWALIEGPALFALVIYYLSGATLALAAGLVLVWVGIGLTFPRAAWFPAARDPSGP